METRYTFVDAGYLWEEHVRFTKMVLGEVARIDYAELRRHSGARKVFVYDCVPADAEKTLRRQMLRDLPFEAGIHVREGTLAGEKDRQKEVDVLAAVEMLSHAFRRNMTEAVLIAGDLDFRPVVRELVAAGVYVHLWARHTSLSLLAVELNKGFEALFDQAA